MLYLLCCIYSVTHLILEEINKQARMNDCRCFNDIDIVRDPFIYTFNVRYYTHRYYYFFSKIYQFIFFIMRF